MQRRNLRSLLTLLGIAAILTTAFPASAANIVLINFDPPGQGLNDPTPVAPIGGNPATTLGGQRQFVYLYAANLWGSVLQSDAPIFVGATFRPLFCTPTSGTLGAAGSTFVVRNFPNATAPNTWHHSALADALAGQDQVPGFIDIFSQFNSRIGTDPACLGGRGWYYGIDSNQGTDFDFFSVVMHEIAHGLGFQNFANEATGTLFLGIPDVYTNKTLDTTTGLTWSQMSDAERAASAVNDRKVVWNGNEVTYQAQNVLGPRPSMVVLTPGSIAGSVEVQPASFGASFTANGGTTGKVVVANDGSGVASDACQPLINDANGKIVLADRGGCTFTSKVGNAQAAGAKGVLIANNNPAGLPPMGGFDPNITIPAAGISQADGAAIKANIFPTVNVKIILDSNFRAGTEQGFVRLYAPTTVSLGSSGSHFDVSATPNLLMEPFISSDLAPGETLDLTPALFRDIGWTLIP